MKRPSRVRPAAWRFVVALLAAVVTAVPAGAQTTGRIVGRVTETGTGRPLPGARIGIREPEREAVAGADGRYVLVGVPAGIHEVTVQLLGYAPVHVRDVRVRVAVAAEVNVALEPSAVEVEPLVVRAERVPLIEPEIPESRELVPGPELRQLPITRTKEAVELATGVSDGHFRGGRVGQETYLVDGVAVKNPLEASSEGSSGFELAPTSLQELEVITGGFSAEYGSAISGVVSYRTRSGNPDRWEAQASLLTDRWAPEESSAGYTGLDVNGGGPLRFLGDGATLFADLRLEGLLDADPRARGLTCLQPGDAPPDLAQEIRALRDDPATSSLYCPFSRDGLPNQTGDRLIGFARLDKRIGEGALLTGTFLHNRFQRGLYTPELKYLAGGQLGQRNRATLATLVLDLARQANGGGLHLVSRLSAGRLDRYLGVIDASWLAGRGEVAGFGLSGFRFAGEEFVRSPIEEQLDAARPVPGYAAPGGIQGSPFGPAAEGILVTQGTSGIASWSRSDFLSVDLVGESLRATGDLLRAGLSGKLYRAENYERARAWLAGSAPNYARFYPATLAGFAEGIWKPAELFSFQAGLRVEGFRSGLDFRPERSDFLAPVVSSDWKVEATPRIGVAGAFRNSAGRSSFRMSYARVAQPPDFQYFLDSTVGDSLRTDVQRQGNPNLAFESGRAYEVGVSHLFGEVVGLELTAYRKELTNLVTGNVQLAGTPAGQFTTGDKGTVQGVEATLRVRVPGLEGRVGYALGEATGITPEGTLDSVIVGPERTKEVPLAFDRRHTLDVVLLFGRSAARPGESGADESARGLAGLPIGAALTAKARSGYPLIPADPEALAAGDYDRLPWTFTVDLALRWDVARLPGCTDCRLGILLDARNLLGRDNVIALRRDSGELGPTLATVEEYVDRPVSTVTPVPRESTRYEPVADLDGNGLIDAEEFAHARFAAALDRVDPSILYGERRQLRLGVEVRFR